MVDVFVEAYDDIADENLEELRSEIGCRNTERYTLSIDTGQRYG